MKKKADTHKIKRNQGPDTAVEKNHVSDNQGKPLIDVKAVIDDLKKKKRHVDFLSQEEKRAILDSRTSPHTPPGDDYVRAYFKERVGRLRNTLDAQDREASASDTIFFQIDTLSDHANRGHNSATGYQERTNTKTSWLFKAYLRNTVARFAIYLTAKITVSLIGSCRTMNPMCCAIG